MSVVLPFHGSTDEAAEALRRLAGIATRDDDERLLVDNTEAQVTSRLDIPPGVRVETSPVPRSAYAARNVGAERSRAPWILFLDADCRPVADILDRYFEPEPGERVGALAGGLHGTPGQPGLIPAYINSRRHLEQADLLEHPYRPMAVTANLLVRRDAFVEIGGYQEVTRSGADADFTWRLQDAGWTLDLREAAGVTHDHRETLRALLVQTARDGAAAPWLSRRHAGHHAFFGLRLIGRALLGALAWPVLLQPRRGLFKALDGIWGLAFDAGTLSTNAAPTPAPDRLEALVVVEEFPRRGDPLVTALDTAIRAGRTVHVLAARRPEYPDWTCGRLIGATFGEDEAPRRVLAAVRAALQDRRRPPRPAVAVGAAVVRACLPGALVVAEPGTAIEARKLIAAARRKDLTVRVAVSDEAAELLAPGRS